MATVAAAPEALPAGGSRLAGRAGVLLRSPRLIAGLGIVVFFVLLGAIGTPLAGDPNVFSHAEWQAPSAAHWLGTTQLGQDVFAQLVSGTLPTLEVGAGAGLIAMLVSIVIGIGGGYLGGFVDEALSLLSNVVLVIPALPLIIVITAYVKANGTVSMILVIALVSWAASARVLRAQTLSVRSREYVLAARAAGERSWRIIAVEILPNELPVIVSQFIFAMIFAILTLAGLAFLGLTDTSQQSWANMLYFAQNDQALQSGAWWWLVPPGLCIALVGMGLALINFSLDEILNPRLRVYRPSRPRRRPPAESGVSPEPAAARTGSAG
ncbi:MAG TPA: ABC transporter permease [Streptosporangiaceae bacterium]